MGAPLTAGASFGRLILGKPVDVVQALEQEYSPAAELRSFDTITTALVRASVNGEQVVDLRDEKPHDVLSLLTLSPRQKASVESRFGLARQQEKGAWFLPEVGTVKAGSANLRYYFERLPRFAIGVAHEQRGKCDFRRSPEALYFWAVLEPLFETILRPLELRGPAPAKGEPAGQLATWEQVERAYDALGMKMTGSLAVFRYGGTWGRLESSRQLLEARELFFTELREQVHDDLAPRFRIWRVGDLVDKYYARGKRQRPLMRQVLTKPLQRVLSGCFGGDWAAFLAYLGEEMNPDDKISASLPAKQLDVGRRGSTGGVHDRVAVMRSFWNSFDATHRSQATGQQSLWGFIEDHETVSLDSASELTGSDWYHPGLHRRLLPAGILASIEQLWDGAFLPGHPVAIVTAISPYARMCDAFGPALRFWHGVALTAWFVTEGPRSRTDIPGLEAYYEKDLREMRDLGCPVDPSLFSALLAAEKRLGEPESIYEPDPKEVAVEGVGKLTFKMSIGSRRSGFEYLRRVLDVHRATWAEGNIEPYLQARWDTELRRAAYEFRKFAEVKGKPPTLKQFGKLADQATNHWFGGDISQLYAAMGEQSPVEVGRSRLLTRPVVDFAKQVFAALGGKPTRWEDLAATIQGRDREKQDMEWRLHGSREKLAELSVWYVQLWEALGRPPSLQEFGVGKFSHLAASLDSDVGHAWTVYGSAISASLPR